MMIKTENMFCGYANKTVLKNINLEVAKGEIIGVVGPNGSGKTTLIRALTGILRNRKGKVFIDNSDLDSLTVRQISKKAAVVSQNLSYIDMTVYEYCMLGRIPHYGKLQFFEQKEDRDTVDRYLDITGLDKIKNDNMAQLSGGQRQLASVARALVQETEILLLDEPTSHLDISHKAEIMDLIVKIRNERGITCMIVFHDLNLASEYCDSMILIDKGNLFESGSPSGVLSYMNIEKVFNTKVVVKNNPLSGKPHVFIVPEKLMNGPENS